MKSVITQIGCLFFLKSCERILGKRWQADGKFDEGNLYNRYCVATLALPVNITFEKWLILIKVKTRLAYIHIPNCRSFVLFLPISSPSLFTSRSGTQCHSQGGTCEPMINCLLNGLVAGQCHGMFAVCCHRPTPANRWIESRMEGSSTGSQAVGRKVS